MAVLADSRAANLGESVSSIFNDQYRLDRNQALAVATIIGRNPNYNREPDYWLHIFNISPRTFNRERPPDFPHIVLPGCPADQPYVLACKVPNIINYKWVSPETGNPVLDSIDGERWATDLVNPANLGRQMWVSVTNPEMQQMHGAGDDLSIRGVFWSRNETPSEDELAMSRKLMESHYRQLVQNADVLARDPKTVREIGHEHHMAADYLRVNSSWHITTASRLSCPNCGDDISSGIAFHKSTSGVICVLDWKKSVLAGAVKRDDVPEELQWWNTPTEPAHEERKGKRR